MEVFEVHITGDKSIIEKAAELGLKTISVHLLRPDRTHFRTEHMTSHIMRCKSYIDCKRDVDSYVKVLESRGVSIIRVKIESPYYEHYRTQSLYMESHFEAEGTRYPISQNARKATFLATDREYNLSRYNKFREKYKGKELELALYDTDVNEDKDWFDLYENNSR